MKAQDEVYVVSYSSYGAWGGSMSADERANLRSLVAAVAMIAPFVIIAIKGLF